MCTPFKCVHTGYDPVICLHCSTYKVFLGGGGGGGGGGVLRMLWHTCLVAWSVVLAGSWRPLS